MLTKQITYAGEFLEDGQIQVKEITRIMEDGVETGAVPGKLIRGTQGAPVAA